MLEKHRLDLRLLKKLLARIYLKRVEAISAVLLILLARLIEAYVPIKLGWMAQDMLRGAHETITFIYEGMILAGLLILGYLLDALSVWLKSRVGSHVILNLRKEVFNRIQKLPLDTFDKQPVGKLMTRTMHDVDQINLLFSESLLPIMGSLILFFLIITGMFWLDFRAAMIILGIIPLVLALTNYFRNHQRKGYTRIRELIQEMNGFVQEHLHGIITIRHFGLEKEELKAFDKINDHLCNAYITTNKNFVFYIAGNDFFQSLAIISAYLALAFYTPFNAGVFFAFTLYIMMIFRPLGDMAERYNVLQSAFSATERIFEILSLEEEKGEGESLSAIETVEFKQVWFHYGRGEWVLKGINFKINPSEVVAIVGHTGAGKSTLASLLLGFYTPQKGEILLNGRPIQSWSLSSLRGAFSTVLQDPFLFSGSIEQNVAFFNPHISEKEVKKALDYVDFNRPSTAVKNLSAGEKQLVSLARAVAHHGSFLLLDEATANIDPLTEKTIQSALEKILKGRSALVIAHRLSTIKDATRILVLSQGQVVEHGTHKTLIEKKGIYEKLYRLGLS